jgi:hypothetical protein
VAVGQAGREAGAGEGSTFLRRLPIPAALLSPRRSFRRRGGDLVEFLKARRRLIAEFVEGPVIELPEEAEALSARADRLEEGRPRGRALAGGEAEAEEKAGG